MKSVKAVIFWFLIVVSAMLLWQLVRSSPTQQAEQRTPEISYSQFMSEAEAGQVARVNIAGNRIRGEYHDGKGTFHLIGPGNPDVFLDTLRSKGVEIWFKDVSSDSLPLQLLGTWAPLILLGALWFFMIRQMQARRVALDRSGSPDAPVEPH
jgi:cell division protease FtsH